MMIIAIDVHYRNDAATAGGVVFASWECEDCVDELVFEIDGVAGYQPGQFYLRELPCILGLLTQVRYPLSHIVIDGYVFLEKDQKPGLGMHLWNSLGGRVPVIGVAKSRYGNTPEETELYRGASRRPLYVTSVGLPMDEAKVLISRMKGGHRIPILLKKADQLCRKTI